MKVTTCGTCSLGIFKGQDFSTILTGDGMLNVHADYRGCQESSARADAHDGFKMRIRFVNESRAFDDLDA
jgi:hypothetical protein